MKGLLDSIRALGSARVGILAGVTLGILAAFVWLELHGPGQGRMAVLASNLDPGASQQLATTLTGQKIPYKLESGQILVPQHQLGAAKALMGSSGITSDPIVGYEAFDRGNDLAMTAFDQQVKLTRALEGELARTIVSMRGIVHARVHLVLPRREPFAHDVQHAQASVMLTLAGRQSLSPEAVQSVVDLVAASVPGLRPQDVTVVDSNLHLLMQAGDGNDPRTRTALQDDIRHRTESRLSQAVELMLEPMLGPGHVHAQASIRMNFDKINETQEKYDPDGSVVRSTQTTQSNSKSTDKSGNVSVQNNLPNAEAANTTTGNQEGRQEETTNYEITKTVRQIVHDQPQIERVSLAVMVDGVDQTGPDGKHSAKPREKAELDTIEKLVKSAVGYDEKRGDSVEIVSLPFVEVVGTSDTASASTPLKSNRDLITFLQVVMAGVVGLGTIIMVARSIITMLKQPVSGVRLANALAGDGAASGVGPMLPGASGEAPTAIQQAGAAGGPAGGSAGQLAIAEEDDVVSISNIEGQMRASSIRKVTQLVDRHPDTTLSIIRGWISTDQG